MKTIVKDESIMIDDLSMKDDPSSIEDIIIGVIRNIPLSSSDILYHINEKYSNLNYDKYKLNRELYKLYDRRVITKTNSASHPKWLLVNNVSSTSDIKRPLNTKRHIIMIDMGNVHTTLQYLVPYIDDNDIEIYGFADKKTNVWGINPKAPMGMNIFQVTDSEAKNAAETLLQWFLCKLIFEDKYTNCIFYIVTMDRGFMYIENLVNGTKNNSLVFLKSWDELRLYIE